MSNYNVKIKVTNNTNKITNKSISVTKPKQVKTQTQTQTSSVFPMIKNNNNHETTVKTSSKSPYKTNSYTFNNVSVDDYQKLKEENRKNQFENKNLKMEVVRLEKEINQKDKILKDISFGNEEVLEKGKESYIIGNLKRQIKELMTYKKIKEEEIEMMKRNVKSTKIAELNQNIQIYEVELVKQKGIIMELRRKICQLEEGERKEEKKKNEEMKKSEEEKEIENNNNHINNIKDTENAERDNEKNDLFSIDQKANLSIDEFNDISFLLSIIYKSKNKSISDIEKFLFNNITLPDEISDVFDTKSNNIFIIQLSKNIVSSIESNDKNDIKTIISYIYSYLSAYTGQIEYFKLKFCLLLESCYSFKDNISIESSISNTLSNLNPSQVKSLYEDLLYYIINEKSLYMTDFLVLLNNNSLILIARDYEYLILKMKTSLSLSLFELNPIFFIRFLKNHIKINKIDDYMGKDKEDRHTHERNENLKTDRQNNLEILIDINANNYIENDNLEVILSENLNSNEYINKENNEENEENNENYDNDEDLLLANIFVGDFLNMKFGNEENVYENNNFDTDFVIENDSHENKNNNNDNNKEKINSIDVKNINNIIYTKANSDRPNLIQSNMKIQKLNSNLESNKKINTSFPNIYKSTSIKSDNSLSKHSINAYLANNNANINIIDEEYKSSQANNDEAYDENVNNGFVQGHVNTIEVNDNGNFVDSNQDLNNENVNVYDNLNENIIDVNENTKKKDGNDEFLNKCKEKPTSSSSNIKYIRKKLDEYSNRSNKIKEEKEIKVNEKTKRSLNSNEIKDRSKEFTDHILNKH